MQNYKFNILSYGTAPASLLSTCCLLQLALENEADFPNASIAVRPDLYVDDLMTGTVKFDSTKKLIVEIQHKLKKGGFRIYKCNSKY